MKKKELNHLLGQSFYFKPSRRLKKSAECISFFHPRLALSVFVREPLLLLFSRRAISFRPVCFSLRQNYFVALLFLYKRCTYVYDTKEKRRKNEGGRDTVDREERQENSAWNVLMCVGARYCSKIGIRKVK